MGGCDLLIQLTLIISMINGRIEAVAKRNDCDWLRWKYVGKERQVMKEPLDS